MKNQRRSTLKRVFASFSAFVGLGAAPALAARPASAEKRVHNVHRSKQDVPLFSGSVVHGNTVYVAGKGAHFEGDIKAHTDHVLKELEKELKQAGSSMEKVVKVNVYLHDLRDYDAMNETYQGRFGAKPPVRTTIAPFGGVPGNSLVEMDCIAML